MIQLYEYFAEMETRVARTISPKDEMFNFTLTRVPDDAAARAYYFETGRELASALLGYLIEVGRNPEELDLLDFAAGYGRVTRWLVSAFRTVTMADLERSMVDFHKAQYGIPGFLSHNEPSTLTAHRLRYDVIFVFSMFTHLPPSSWKLWLKALASILRPGGHLVFSTHSYELFAILHPERYGEKDKWVEEFLFWEGNETNGRLEPKIYGSNIIKDSYICTAVGEVPNLELVRHFKMGEFDRYHDVYVTQTSAESSLLPSRTA